LFAQVQEERSNAESARQQAEQLREQKLTLQPRSKKELIQSQLAELQTDVVARHLTVYSRVDNGEIGI